jgi:transcriptional regulator with XRE-family HTH domain
MTATSPNPSGRASASERPRVGPAAARFKPIVGPREIARRHRQLRSSIGRQITELREEAGITVSELARGAGIDLGHLWRIEAGSANASLEVLVAIAATLGADLGTRLFPGSGPRLHDRFQAPMIEALLRHLDSRWMARPEFAVPSARGVIDLVLALRGGGLTIACECHSELRRLEQVLRRSNEKAIALEGPEGSVSRLLLLRSTTATRDVARHYEATLAAAYPARSADALAALRGETADWPGPAIIWARLEGGRAQLLDGPPRGVRVGR